MVGVLGLGLVALMGACYKTPAGTAASSSPTGASFTVRSASATVSGGTRKVLVDPQGFTLYYRSKDTASTVCTASCANTWPPLVQPSGAPTASSDLTGRLEVTANANGNQVAYNGHPLYRYSGDIAPGQATGQGFSGIWFVVDP